MEESRVVGVVGRQGSSLDTPLLVLSSSFVQQEPMQLARDYWEATTQVLPQIQQDGLWLDRYIQYRWDGWRQRLRMKIEE